MSVFAKKRKQRDREEQLRQACSQEHVAVDTIRPLVQAHPKALQKSDSHGCCPLHLACQCGASLDVIQFLVESYPAAAQQPDAYGCLPLHWACYGKSSLQVVEYLMSQYPQAVQHQTQHGEVPLHFASHAGRLEVIQVLYHEYPQAIHVTTRFGELPIHSMFHETSTASLGAVGFLVSHYPSSLQIANENGMLPLALACGNEGAQVEVIEYLAQQYPDAVTTVDKGNELPLHRACECRAPLEVLDCLVEQFPESIEATTVKGNTSLHLACTRGASLDVVKFLVECWPESAQVSNDNGLLPLHAASGKNARLDVIQYLVSQYPDATNVESVNGMLPVDVAKEMDAPLAVFQYLRQWSPASVNESASVPFQVNPSNIDSQLITACREVPPSINKILPLVQASPSSVRARNEDGELPLHIACSNGASLDVVECIVRAWSDVVAQKDNREWIPLHSACSNAAPLDVIKFLVEQYPDSVMQTTNYGMLPLHRACSNSAPLDVIQFLVELWPNSVTVQSDLGELALHKACECGAPLAVIDYLNQAWPDSIQQVNDMGELPLQLSCNEKGQLAVVQYLSTQWPAAVKESDNGGLTPLHYACEHGGSVDIIQHLLSQWQDAGKTRTKDGDLAVHLASASGASLEVVQCLVRQWPDSVNAENGEGLTPIELARKPFAFHRLQPDVIKWLDSVGNGKLELLAPEKPAVQKRVSKRRSSVPRTFEKERSKLQMVISGERDVPVSVHTKYVETITKGQKALGKGIFGVVVKGTDDVLEQDFAIKSIDMQLLVGGSKDELERIKNEFKREQKALLQVRHPNVALLYAYALSSHHHRGHYLLYDLAEKGSLDAFWNSDLGRERLSSFAQRAQIAIDAFIGLRFLHVGNKHISPSFHGDVKSANIVLKRDFTAQLIDCGLGAFATVIPQQDITSVCLRGTRGYACPKYCAGALSFDESCDIFSFGVVLAELWSGSLQNRVDATGRARNFFDEYIDADKPRWMQDDLDKAYGIDSEVELPLYMEQFRHLALACMLSDPTKRPDGREVLNGLERIWQSCNPHDNLDMADDAWSLNESLQSISDSSGTDDSVCQICRSYAVEVGYDECPLCLALHVQRVVKAKAVPRELDAKYTALAVKKYKSFRSEARSLYDFKEEKSSDPLLPIRDLRLNHSLPRLFVLLPADDVVRDLLPSAWLRSTVPMRMNLYFVCQDTLELVEPPVPMSVSRVWISRIALLLGMSLTLLKQSRSRGKPHAFDGTTVDQVELSEMLNAVHHLLQDDNNANDLDTLQRVKSSATLSDADVEALNGPSYELVAERARQDVGWRSSIAPVRKLFNVEILWVATRVADDSENDYEVIDV